MWKKIGLIIILAGAYTFIMMHYPTDLMKAAGYNQVLDAYATVVSRHCQIKIIHNPGLRKLNYASAPLPLKAVIPRQHNNYIQDLNQILERGGTVIECSGLDAWHTTDLGKSYLHKLRDKAYRVVIMDGGHHLPTLGLDPDIIIVPAAAGYAVHAAALDGLAWENIIKIAREADTQAVIAVVPRYALVKNEKSLSILTRRILDSCPYREERENFEPCCQPQISKKAGVIMAYVNRGYASDVRKLYQACRQLGLNDVVKIYLAFDYNVLNKAEAAEYARSLQKTANRPVIRVNEPVKTSNVMFWRNK